jgi:hypothetical protein
MTLLPETVWLLELFAEELLLEELELLELELELEPPELLELPELEPPPPQAVSRRAKIMVSARIIERVLFFICFFPFQNF